jgi:hypothetical protein
MSTAWATPHDREDVLAPKFVDGLDFGMVLANGRDL